LLGGNGLTRQAECRASRPIAVDFRSGILAAYLRAQKLWTGSTPTRSTSRQPGLGEDYLSDQQRRKSAVSWPMPPSTQLLHEHGRACGDFCERIGLAVVVHPSHQAVEVHPPHNIRTGTTRACAAFGWVYSWKRDSGKAIGKIMMREQESVKGVPPAAGDGKMSEQLIPEMTADELRAISRKLSAYVELHPGDSDARSLAIRCGEIAALLEAPSDYHAMRMTDPGSEGIEDRVLRIASGAPLTRREVASCRHLCAGGWILVYQHS
jgi:hypothetical protein